MSRSPTGSFMGQHSGHTLCFTVLGATLVLFGCGSGVVNSPSTTGTPPTSASTKAPIHGLVSMNNESFITNPNITPDNSQSEPIADPNIYAASVVMVTWKQLQPNNGSTLDTSAIEAGLSAITAYNSTHAAHPMKAKLRVFAGVNAPAWVLAIDGGPFTATINGNTGSIAKFWTADYTTAWTNLQNQLAAVYDKDSRIQEVAVSGCASRTAEPFIFTSDATVIPSLQAAGYTDAQFQTCLSSMATQYAAWANTPLDYTFNGFTHLDTGRPVIDTNFPIQVMVAWRTALGTARGIVANHGLQPTLATDAPPIYAEFSVLGPPLEFQALGPTVNWDQTIALGLTFHPSEIEIWQTTQGGGSAVISYTQLQAYAGQI